MSSNRRFPLFTIGMSLFLSLASQAARAQSDSNVSPGTVRTEVRQLINDLNDPNYDYSKIPERMREVYQDARSATASMDPVAAAQFRDDLMQQVAPVMAANWQKIQDAMQTAYIKNLQQPLGCSDDEFAAIRPYLLKVINDARDLQLARFRFGPPNKNTSQGGQTGQPTPQRPPGPPPGATTSAVQLAANDLQQALSDPNANSDLIKNKLDALRQAQTKAEQDLKVARSDLQALLTERQEAVLVEYGLME